MGLETPPAVQSTISRAQESRGGSATSIHRMVAREVARRQLPAGGHLVDVGCGTGAAWGALRGLFGRYTGVDIVRYDGFPADQQYLPLDLDTGRVPLPDGSADCVMAVETIEHLENPRQLVRELVRLARPGGCVIVTTPNQQCLTSLLSLVTRGHFDAFMERPGNYPAHITALLELDLLRIARENHLSDIHTAYSRVGRVPFTGGRYWPALFGGGRLFSDNVLVSGTTGSADR